LLAMRPAARMARISSDVLMIGRPMDGLAA
jgi:hypothetical protein